MTIGVEIDDRQDHRRVMSRKRRPHPRDIEKFVYSMLDEDIHAIRRGLAAANGLVERHMTKQVDGFIGNKKLDLDALVTAKGYQVSTVICVYQKGMKDPRCIVASDSTLKGSTVKRLYGKRFSC